jgi:hypothetical protein
LSGKANDKDGVPKFLVDTAKEFGQTTIPTPANATSVTIRIPASVSEDIFIELKKIFESFPGELEVNLMINQQKVRTPFRVSVTEEFRTRVSGLIGTVASTQT